MKNHVKAGLLRVSFWLAYMILLDSQYYFLKLCVYDHDYNNLELKLPKHCIKDICIRS